jgi:thiol-disulfide isomerase/thioredoxin
MSKKPFIAILLILFLVGSFSAMQQAPAPAVPKTSATTPAGCLQEVRDYVAKRQQEMMAATAPATPPTTVEATRALNQLRSPLISQINQARNAMAKECAARLDVTKLADRDFMAMADLYTEAGQPELTRGVVDRAIASKSLSPADRAGILLYAVGTGLKEPKSDERNARLEKYVDELDKSSAATIDQKLSAHAQMNGWYRYDDVDSGIIKHSTWIIEAATKFTPEQRQKSGNVVISAHVNLAQAWAGQGMNDKALNLLETAKTALADVPNVSRSVDPEIARLKMVGTAAAAIVAPRWLNMPAGKTELPMPGSVTLLEFSAHWCIPCKESYPGVQRLLAKYQSKGFRVVLATQYYGYFEQERPLAPEVEFERDRKYFAEHGMNVPVAVADMPTTNSPNPNNRNYQVGGIPQIHLVDKQGRIRLVMVGYDDDNEPKLAKMIEDLLKEN